MTPSPFTTAFLKLDGLMSPSKNTIPSTVSVPGVPGAQATRPSPVPSALYSRQSYAYAGRRSTTLMLEFREVSLSRRLLAPENPAPARVDDQFSPIFEFIASRLDLLAA